MAGKAQKPIQYQADSISARKTARGLRVPMPEQSTIGFGRYLRSAREERAVDLRAVSRETRVGLDLLRAIEDEDHGRLPAEVFVKGFLRAYARVVGADGDEAVRKYLNSRHLLEASVQAEADRIRVSRRFWPRMMAIGGGFAVIVALALALTVPSDPPNGPSLPTPPPESTEAALPAETPAPAPSVLSKPPAPEEKAVPAPNTDAPPSAPPLETVDDETVPKPADRQRHLLEITASEETWMKVIVDNLSAREYTFRSGDRLELEARDGFNLLIGNAGGISAVLDGRRLPDMGKSGQVVTLKLP